MPRLLFDAQVALIGMITFGHLIGAFKITRCGSNVINEVEFDAVNKKALIKYDHLKPLSVPGDSVNIELFCESNTFYQTCSLTHQVTNSSTKDTKCKYAYPTTSARGDICQENDNIKFVPSSATNCSFTLSRISETGKKMLRSTPKSSNC